MNVQWMSRGLGIRWLGVGLLRGCFGGMDLFFLILWCFVPLSFGFDFELGMNWVWMVTRVMDWCLVVW